MKKEVNYAKQRLIMKLMLVVFVAVIVIGTPLYYSYNLKRESFAMEYLSKFEKNGKSTLANKTVDELKSEGFIDADQTYEGTSDIVKRISNLDSKPYGFRFYKADPMLGLVTVEVASSGYNYNKTLLKITAINLPKVNRDMASKLPMALISGTDEQKIVDGWVAFNYEDAKTFVATYGLQRMPSGSESYQGLFTFRLFEVKW